ncbi:MAG: hypothetical protein HZC28_20440 [Spirochaetes bacterium]|nr:hypothetical protein [Spirochaetota bacterium]
MNTISCPKCGAAFTPEVIFENAELSWPSLDLIYFRCPKCYAYTYIRVSVGTMATVNLLSPDGKQIETIQSITVENITVRKTAKAMTVIYNGNEYDYNALA